MKTRIILALVLLILLTSAFIMRKSFDQHLTLTDITVMRDITDVQISQPKIEDISGLLNLNNSKWDGANFRFVDITDVSYNHISETKILPENQWMGNELDRDKKVKQFYTGISQILTVADTEKVGKANSAIYKLIASELNRLSQSTSQKRILLIYSDLTENTDEFSLYKKNNIDLIKTNPESVQKQFEAQAPLKNLKGINVYLVYQPTNQEADEQYKLIAGFYQKFLESKGATVEITANIN